MTKDNREMRYAIEGPIEGTYWMAPGWTTDILYAEYYVCHKDAKDKAIEIPAARGARRVVRYRISVEVDKIFEWG